MDLQKDIWHGPVNCAGYKIESKVGAPGIEETRVLEVVLNQLKCGNFENKDTLYMLMNQSEDERVISTCIDVFTYTCNHKDFLNRKYFSFLGRDRSGQRLVEFAESSIFMLSQDVVMYLLVYLEDWEGSEIGYKIRKSLDRLLPRLHCVEDDLSIGEIQAKFDMLKRQFKDQIMNRGIRPYEYEGKVFSLNSILDDLHRKVQEAEETERVFKDWHTLKLLSNATGQPAPDIRDKRIDRELLVNVQLYIEKIRKMNLSEGRKYYYGHLVD